MIMLGRFYKTKYGKSPSLPDPVSHPAASALAGAEFTPLHIVSSAFPSGGLLPMAFRYGACNYNPPLQIGGLPTATRSLLVLLEHRNAPIAPRTHWICWDLPPVQNIKENEKRGVQGRNHFLINGYTGPFCPSEPRRFCIVVLALRRVLHLPAGSSCFQAKRIATSETLAKGELSFFA